MPRSGIAALFALALGLLLAGCGGSNAQSRIELLAALEEIPGFELWDPDDNCEGCDAAFDFNYETTAFGAYTAVKPFLDAGSIDSDCMPAADECRAIGTHSSLGKQVRFLFQSDFGSAIVVD